MTEENPNQGEQEAPEEQRKPLSLLASERFGQNFHGEVESPAEPSETEEREEPATEEPEAPEEPEGAEEPSTEEAGTAEAEETTETVEYQLSDLAQVFGVDEESFDVEDGRVLLRGKVDGEEVRVSVKDLLDNHQKLTAADKRLEEAKQRVVQQKQAQAEATEKLNEEYGVAARLIERVEKSLNAEEESVDWKALKQDDPATYSAKKLDLEERRKGVAETKKEAREKYQEAFARRQKEAEAEQGQYLEAERVALLKALPDWKNPDTAKAEQEKLAEYLKGAGFSAEELSKASDHRIVVLARKAMLHDQREKTTDAKKKKVNRAPMVLKPGASKPQSEKNKEQVNKLHGRLKETGNIKDALAVMRARRVQ